MPRKKSAFKIKLTKKQAKIFKSAATIPPLKVYAIMDDGVVLDVTKAVTIIPSIKLKEQNPYTFKITLKDVSEYKT